MQEMFLKPPFSLQCYAEFRLQVCYWYFKLVRMRFWLCILSISQRLCI